jgi:hypothetical protein
LLNLVRRAAISKEARDMLGDIDGDRAKFLERRPGEQGIAEIETGKAIERAVKPRAA